VPLSLLWGVAFAESGFDPTKIGPQPKVGDRAVGLMQLQPKTAAAYGVTDLLDPVQSALGAAKFLAKLGKALQWDVDAMLAAYVWGPVSYARYKANPGTSIPAEVSTYVRRALAARDTFRNKASRPAGQLMVALNQAIERLAALNPSWQPAVMTRDQWRPFYAKRGTDTDVEALTSPLVKAQWQNYRAAYERAPITDESTPTPDQVEPDIWRAASNTVDRVVQTAKHVGEQTLGIGAALFILAVFVFATGSRRR
jgi:hypothetical protein